MLPMIPLEKAGHIILAGGVVTYPTEGVFGLGCLPDDEDAVDHILEIKQRRAAMGLILIASGVEQLRDWIDFPEPAGLLASAAPVPVTWVVPAAPGVPAWIRGDHTTVAVRITSHPVAAALCDAIDGPLVSTSANLSGRPPARNIYVLRRNFGDLVDYVVPGECGPYGTHSEIREFATGAVLRKASA